MSSIRCKQYPTGFVEVYIPNSLDIKVEGFDGSFQTLTANNKVVDKVFFIKPQQQPNMITNVQPVANDADAISKYETAINSFNGEIANYEGTLNTLQEKINKQQAEVTRAKNDNAQKAKIANIYDTLCGIDFSQITTVQIPQGDIDTVKNTLKRIEDLCNSVRVYESDQQNILDSLSSEQSQLICKKERAKNKLEAAKLNLKVAIEDEEQRLQAALARVERAKNIIKPPCSDCAAGAVGDNKDANANGIQPVANQ